MKKHLDLLKEILATGVNLPDRTGAGRRKVFGRQLRFNLQEGFPLPTTRQMFTGTLIKETLWFLTGSCSNKDLRDKGVSIWNLWELTDEYLDRFKSDSVSLELINRVKEANDRVRSKVLDNFLKEIHTDTKNYFNYKPVELGDSIRHTAIANNRINSIGRMYGAIWRGKDTEGDRVGRDQIAELVYNLKNDPYGSRHCVSAWDPETAALPDFSPEENVLLGFGCLTACHCFFQCIVIPNEATGKNQLSLALNIRSSDTPVGLSYNIAQYALLTHMLAQVTDMEVGDLVINLGDAHIYFNQIETAKIHVQREPLPLPSLWLNPEIKNIDDFKFDDIRIENYKHHEKLDYKVNK